jgi:hypothetical protein
MDEDDRRVARSIGRLDFPVSRSEIDTMRERPSGPVKVNPTLSK